MTTSICEDEGKTYENEVSPDSQSISDIQSHTVRASMFVNLNAWDF
jgi:hypothetical protein